MRLITNWLEKRAAERREKQERVAERLEAARAEVNKAEKEMVSKQCPFVRAKCSTGCIHFERGSVSSFVDFDDRTHVFSDLPRCKLWRE